MLYFERPLYLALCLLAPLYWALRRFALIGRIEFPLTLGDWGGPTLKWNSVSLRVARVLSASAVSLSFLLAVVALAGPVRLLQETVFSGSGNVVIFVVDVSPSMAAGDMGDETRIDASRRLIASLVSRRPGTSFGLAALGSSAALLVPPTVDHQAFLSRLSALAVGEFGDGTALGLGLAVAAAHGGQGTRARTTAILLTDGENNAGEIHPSTAAGLLAARGIQFFVIGVGSRGQVPVDYVDPATGRHYSGLLESDFNEGALREIAMAGNGGYAGARDRAALEKVFETIDSAVPVTSNSWTRSIEEPLDRPLVLIALALFAAAWFIRRLIMGALI